MKNAIVACGLVVTLASCGGSGTAESTTGTEQAAGGETPAATALPPEQACLATMRRERECQDQFLPALVALRVRLDFPPGIAAADASEGRDALVAQARGEYTAGATDETFQRNCAQMAEMPAEQSGPWTEMMNGCLASTECDAFVECDMRFTEARFSQQR